MKLKYHDFIYGYSNCGPNTSKIINWEFKEIIDYSRTWIGDRNKWLMMAIRVCTEKGDFIDDFFEQKSELMKIIRKELYLNLKLQHNILK